MKKCTLVLMIIFTIVACKKGEVNSTATTTETNGDKASPLSYCLTLEGYYKLSNIEEKAEWLRQNGDNVCECTMEEAVLEDHRVKGTVSNQKGKYLRKWGDIKSIINSHGYDAYINIEYSGDTITGLKLVDRYISDSVSYRFSTILFKSLAKKYAKDDNAEFQFSFAMLDQTKQPVVVIQVVGNSSTENPVDGNPYYDYSTDPKIAPTDNIPL